MCHDMFEGRRRVCGFGDRNGRGRYCFESDGNFGSGGVCGVLEQFSKYSPRYTVRETTLALVVERVYHSPEYLASTLSIKARVLTVTASSSFPDPNVLALSALKSMVLAMFARM